MKERIEAAILKVVSHLEQYPAKMQCCVGNISEYHALLPFRPELKEKILEDAKDPEFYMANIGTEQEFPYDEYYDKPDIYRLLSLLNVFKGSYAQEEYDEIIKSQTIQGRFGIDHHKHYRFMRSLVAIEPYSKNMQNAINYFEASYESYQNDHEALTIAGIALYERNFHIHKALINKIADALIMTLNTRGTLGRSYKGDMPLEETCLGLRLILSLNRESEIALDEILSKVINEITKEDAKLYRGNLEEAAALLVIFENEKSKEIFRLRNENMLLHQKYESARPQFLHTSPLYQGSLFVRDIVAKIQDVLDGPVVSIKVCSLYIDTLYEKLVELSQQGTKVMIVCRPAKDIKGIRERIGKNVINIFQRTSGISIRSNPLVHSRFIIVDEKMAILMSSDLTRDQLYDEYNVGAIINDQEFVLRLEEYFENLWNESEDIQST